MPQDGAIASRRTRLLFKRAEPLAEGCMVQANDSYFQSVKDLVHNSLCWLGQKELMLLVREEPLVRQE